MIYDISLYLSSKMIVDMYKYNFDKVLKKLYFHEHPS